MNGKAEGVVRRWHENGRIRKQKFFRDGKSQGESKAWRDSGQLQFCQYYVNGHIVDHVFVWRKKCAILKVRKRLKSKCLNSAVGLYIISDLFNVIC